MIPKPPLLAVLSLLMWPSYALTQTCQETISATASSKYFSNNDTNTLLDTRTNLIWSRCSIGQLWSGGKCVGSALLLTYIEARNEARNQSVQEHLGWRIPTVSELSLMVELSCHDPAVDLALFPNTPSMSFWTSTRFVNKLKHHWLIQFRFGANHVDSDDNHAYLRLVRDAE
ncbi:MAG: DUF1566 domain-containing protein [Thiohalomonadales bacterium]